MHHQLKFYRLISNAATNIRRPRRKQQMPWQLVSQVAGVCSLPRPRRSVTGGGRTKKQQSLCAANDRPEILRRRMADFFVKLGYRQRNGSGLGQRFNGHDHVPTILTRVFLCQPAIQPAEILAISPHLRIACVWRVLKHLIIHCLHRAKHYIDADLRTRPQIQMLFSFLLTELDGRQITPPAPAPRQCRARKNTPRRAPARKALAAAARGWSGGAG